MYHSSQNVCFVLQRITFQLDLFLCFAIQILHCIFVQISTIFSYEFLCFIWTFTLVISYEFLCVSYEVSLLILDLISIRTFLSFLCTNRLPYSLYRSVFVPYFHTNFYEFWMLYPWNNESDCNVRIFWCNTHLTMSLIVLSFSQLVLSQFLRLFIVILFLLLPPTTVLCIFFK